MLYSCQRAMIDSSRLLPDPKRAAGWRRWVCLSTIPLLVVLLAVPEVALAADSTPPATPVVTDDGVYTTSNSQLHASWNSSDPESGITEYRYQIRQDSTTGPIILDWTTTKTSTSATKNGLKLLQGKTYYFAVKAKNGVGLWSAVGYSNGIKVDTTTPIAVTVTDDGATTSSTTSLHARWTASSDLESGIAEYQYQIRQDSKSGTVIVAWASAGLTAEVTRTGLNLTPGKSYYFEVRAKNGAGSFSISSFSDGITIQTDTTPPTGTVLINNGDIYTISQTATLTLSASDNSGTVSQMQFSNDGVTYSTPEAYATTKTWTLASGDGTKTTYAKYRDTAGNWSGTVTDTIILDTSPPSTPTVTDDGANTSSTTQLHATWTASSDSQSNVLEYQYQIRRDSSSGSVVVDWTSTGTSTQVTKTGLLLAPGTTYYFTVKARNGAGLWSNVAASDGILCKTTGPDFEVTYPQEGAWIGNS